MKKTTKQVREALREKQPFAFTCRRLLNFIYNDIVDPRGTTVSLQSGALVKTVLSPVSPFLLDTDRGTGSLHLVIIRIDGVRINMQGYRMLHFGGQKSIE